MKGAVEEEVRNEKEETRPLTLVLTIMNLQRDG